MQESWVFQPAGELGQRDLCLLAGEPGAEAVVDTGEEAEVLVVLPLGIEPVRIGEPVRVSLAAASARTTREPFGIVTSATWTSSRVVYFGLICTGGS